MAESANGSVVEVELSEIVKSSSFISIHDLPLEDAIRQKLKSCREVNIVILGCYHVGKSTLINSLFFKKGEGYMEEAKEGSLRRCTTVVSPHKMEVTGISYNIYDSPGMQDGGEGDLVYLRMIRDKCPTIHLVIYCTKMGEPVRPAENEALRNLTLTFGESIWENAVIALTFANNVQPTDPDADETEYFQDLQMKKTQEIRRSLETLIAQKKILEALFKRVYPTGSARILKLPGIPQDWRVDFWYGCLDACLPEGRAALLRLAWRNKEFVLKFIGASVSTTSGGMAVATGIGCVAAGAVLTATGVLAPAGIPLMVAGAVAALLGAGATVGGATGIKSMHKEMKK